MAGDIDRSGLASARSAAIGWQAALAKTARAAGPPLLFGLRLWAAVCLALYVAYCLELENAYWAGTSAALMCQPHLGASLRKGWFRMIGTLVGAVAIVMLTAWFPQDRADFLVGLALWGGICALVATSLRNFGAYAAALAGYTAAIIASDQLGATGGVNGQAFMLAVTRVSEIWIGIVCAGIVLAGTDFGGAPRRLAILLGGLSAEIANRFASVLALVSSAPSDTRSVQPELLGQQPAGRDLLRRVIALDPVIDETIGESSRLRFHSPVLQGTAAGLFAALAGWRTVATRLTRLPDDAAQREADAVLEYIPRELRSVPPQGEPTAWIAAPLRLCSLCDAAIRALIVMPADTPSLRLLADQTVNVLAGTVRALEGLALLLTYPTRHRSHDGRVGHHVPDWLPCLVNGGRAFLTIGAVELFWVVTKWPNGALAITFTAIGVILFAPRADAAYAAAASFMVGVGLAAVCAAIITFAGLPNVQTFAGFSLVLGLVLVPAGALMTQPWQTATFGAMAGNLLPILAPANQMSYDTVQFYNAALAIVAGCGTAALSFRLLPPLSPALRTRRLLRLTLRDLRRLATDPVERLRNDWERCTYSRLAATPDAAEPLQREQLLTALSIGTEIILLRRVAPQLGIGRELDSALQAFARGNSAAATARLAAIDHSLASLADPNPLSSLVVRERGRILAICDAVVRHRAYFDAGDAG